MSANYCEPRDNCAFDSNTGRCVFCGREMGKNWVSTLDEWEAELHRIDFDSHEIFKERLQALIDIVRKKDAALKKMTRIPTHLPDTFQVNPIAEEALALTENLK